MQVENARIKTLDQELKTLKEAVDKMYRLTNIERLNYSMIESQFEMLRDRNKKLSDENALAEKKVQDALSASEQIVNSAKEEKEAIKAQINVMWVKAHARYQELEKMFELADKKVIKEHLKNLEAVAA